jgi:ADP-heptose:LPS heptosyltransferase
VKTGPAARRVVFDLPNWLGDVIHTLPALARLLEPAAAAPSRRSFRPPTCRWSPDRGGTLARPRGAGLWWARRHLAGRFDVAVSARHATRAKLLLAGCAVPLALGSRGRGARLLGLRTFTVDRTRHQRHDLDEALRALGRPAVGEGGAHLALPAAMRDRGLERRRALAGAQRAVVLLPGSRGGRRKRYPAAAYAAAGAGARGVACWWRQADEERLARRVAEVPADGPYRPPGRSKMSPPCSPRATRRSATIPG